CQIKMESLDKDGKATGCSIKGMTNDNGNTLDFRGGPPPTPTGKGLDGKPLAPPKSTACNLTVDARYFIAYTLVKRVPNPYAPEGMRDWGGMTYDSGRNIEPDQ